MPNEDDIKNIGTKLEGFKTNIEII